ncbi:ATP sulfurylase 1 [Hibiscus syriacus]|uniref:ATP sulfurylase 1 n=1 Tax=Hibiscus syriacus TaxID=106335 RepID=A0A6A3BRF2_HIBSY|nr:ATP sulfurylase 1 [Hibiscus syriacus]
MITTGLSLHTFPLSKLLQSSATLALSQALTIFNQIQNPTIFLYNTLISSIVSSANPKCETHHAFSLYESVLWNKNINPNPHTYPSLFKACGYHPWLHHGLALHAHVLKFTGPTYDDFVQTSLLNFYANFGKLGVASYYYVGDFNEVASLSMEALCLFNEMQNSLVKPNEVTLVALVSACANQGALSQGRAGRVQEAEEKLKGMPMKPNSILWRSLLEAARVHGNLQVGEVALNHLLELEPETSGNYVLLSNMYASIDRWEDVTRVRKLMKDHGINKMPGSSLVEVDGAMHEFLTGDTTHPWTERIYLKLVEIGRKLQQQGHKPRTKEVLFDIDEEEKEDALAYHSERLAIAFALIASDSTAPISIVKNLHVCSDCHESSKLISVIYGRDIIVRDRIRFHHFKNGTCSCRDYW